MLRLMVMISDRQSSSHGNGRVVYFRRRPGARSSLAGSTPVADLAKYERKETANDYRHRMMVNAAALVFVVALIGTGLWLADSMAEMRKNQDCVLTGRRGCSPVEVPTQRW